MASKDISPEQLRELPGLYDEQEHVLGRIRKLETSIAALKSKIVERPSLPPPDSVTPNPQAGAPTPPDAPKLPPPDSVTPNPQVEAPTPPDGGPKLPPPDSVTPNPQAPHAPPPTRKRHRSARKVGTTAAVLVVLGGIATGIAISGSGAGHSPKPKNGGVHPTPALPSSQAPTKNSTQTGPGSGPSLPSPAQAAVVDFRIVQGPESARAAGLTQGGTSPIPAAQLARFQSSLINGTQELLVINNPAAAQGTTQIQEGLFRFTNAATAHQAELAVEQSWLHDTYTFSPYRSASDGLPPGAFAFRRPVLGGTGTLTKVVVNQTNIVFIASVGCTHGYDGSLFPNGLFPLTP